MQTVFGLIKNDRLRTVDNAGCNLFAPVCGQAVHEEGPIGCPRHELGRDRESGEGRDAVGTLVLATAALVAIGCGGEEDAPEQSAAGATTDTLPGLVPADAALALRVDLNGDGAWTRVQRALDRVPAWRVVAEQEGIETGPALLLDPYLRELAGELVGSLVHRPEVRA